MKKNEKETVYQGEESRFETWRLEILAAVYDENHTQACELFCRAVKEAGLSKRLSENNLKRLSQIRIFLKKFKEEFIRADSMDIEAYAADLSHLLAGEAKKKAGCIDFDEWQKRTDLTGNLLDRVFQTAMTFQLSTGCSNYCLRCNEWALPGVRSHFSFKAVRTILNHMVRHKNDEISLYGASDPLDWQEEDKSIIDIVSLVKQMPIEYSLLTKVPRAKETILKELNEAGANISVSVTTKNKNRVEQIQNDLDQPLSRQHDTDDLMIPAGRDEDFTTVKPSITDGYGTEITPDGAFIIIPTFTSSLYPFGHKKIRVNRHTSFFPTKKTGRHALLVDYFKPLSGYDADGSVRQLDRLLDVQVESIILDSGDDDLTPPGMRSTKEYLEIFDEKARTRRKNMTLSVIRHLKKKYLANSTFKSLPPDKKQIYKKKIMRHLNLCRPDFCKDIRTCTISFFLESVAAYLKNNPLKAKILRQLLLDESQREHTLFSNFDRITDFSPFFSKSSIEIFPVFRYVMLSMTGAWDTAAAQAVKNDLIPRFIKTNPAVYDPVADLFVSPLHLS